MSIQLGETPITEIPSVEEQQITPVEEMTISEPVSYEQQPVASVSKSDKVKEFFMKDNKKMLYVTIIVAVVIVAIIIVIIVVVKKNGETADAEAEADAAKKAAEDAKESEKNSFWNGSFWGNKK